MKIINMLQLVSTAPYLIKATHTSPSTQNVNDLQFLLEQSTVCKMTVCGIYSFTDSLIINETLKSRDLQGDAVSEFSKDPADNSTNFCSLQNLIDGQFSLLR